MAAFEVGTVPLSAYKYQQDADNILCSLRTLFCLEEKASMPGSPLRIVSTQ